MVRNSFPKGYPRKVEIKVKCSNNQKEKSIYFCKTILEKNNKYQEFIENFEKNKKKDDLADSFLQGIWYLNYKKNICKELIVN